MQTTRRQFLAASAVALASSTLGAAEEVPLILVVTDPLAKENSCPCVAGYGQRDYTELGKALAAAIGKPVQVHFAESLAGALTKKTAGKVDLIIGKDSMIRAQAKEQKLDVVHLAALTGLTGETTQTGLIVVPSSDPVITADQLKGYRVLFGSAAAEEKNAAAKALFKDLNVSVTGEDKDIAASCSDCATKLVDFGKAGEKVAGVISSYALPLLEGCGTIRKGDLKVIGKTEAVPFIAAFATGGVKADVQKKVKAALLDVVKNEALCKAIETKSGFVEADAKKK